MRSCRSLVLAVAILALASWAFAQGADSGLSALKWRSIGPAVTGGRIIDFAVERRNPDVIYAATASGGVWKTINRGTTWEPVFERETSVSVGAIALAPSNENIVWVGTGEANSVRSSSWGDGVYKSEDGGKTWMHMGLEGSRHVGRIVIHPDNPSIVYVAALGSLWGANPERGLFRTTDGGKTWEKVLYVSEHTGVVDVTMDPRDSDLLFAAAFQRERRAWSMIGGGPEGGIYKSTDGGDSWQKLTNGLPTGHVGRIGLAICPSQPDTIYAGVVAPDGGFYRSDDRGASWERRNSRISTLWYYGQVICDPHDAERVYVPMTRFAMSEDGGRTFREDFARGGVHGDYHEFWVDPANPRHMLIGSDGGIYISHDRGVTWDFMAQLPIAQFYTVAVDMREPYYHVYGGTQDNSSLGGPSGTRNSDGIANDDWYVTTGGDGFYSQIDPTDPTTVYAESQYGVLVRFDTRTGERRAIQPRPPEGVKHRWNWSAPLLISSHDPKTLYFAANYLFRSPNRGDTWTTVSPDLTRQLDHYKLPLMGKVWKKEEAIDLHMSTADYSNITTISESTLNRDLLAVGTDDGLVQVTRDGGKTWTKFDKFPGVSDQTYVSRVVLSRFAEGTIYVTFDAHRDSDFKPYVVKSTDYGKTWASIANNLPEFGSTYVITEHLRNSKLLFVGTEFGVFVSFTGGSDWVSLKNNLPTVAVHDIVVHPRENDLVIGTHGRSFWILDDIAALEARTPEAVSGGAQLFKVRPVIAFHRFSRGRNSQGQRFFTAPNPPEGAIITYYVNPRPTGTDKSAQPARVQLDILDAQGKLIRRLDPPRGTGIQRVVWDLRYAPPYEADRREAAAFSGAPRGPFVLPGEYRVQLKVGDVEQTQGVQVKGDPLVTISEADRRAWHDTLVSLSQTLGTLRAALTTGEQIDAQTKAVQSALRARPDTAEALVKQVEGVATTLRGVLRELRGEETGGVAEQEHWWPIADQARRLYTAIEGSTGVPTDDQRRLTTNTRDRLKAEITKLNQLITETLPALNRQLDQAGVGWTPGRPIVML